MFFGVVFFVLLPAAAASFPGFCLLVSYRSLENQDYRDLRECIRATLSAVSPERPLASDQQAAALLRARLTSGIGRVLRVRGCCSEVVGAVSECEWRGRKC